MKLLVINNLSSGYRDGAIYDFIRAVAEDGDEVCLRCTDGTTEIEDLLYDAGHYDLVVASGGDGTVSTVAYALADTGIPILPFPAGTANLLALNLFEPGEPHALAKLAREGHVMEFDIGEVELATGEKSGFSIMAGAGYDAAIMGTAEQTKHLLGPLAYFQAAITNAMPQVSNISVTIDGETIQREGMGVLFMNFSKVQFDIAFIHENLPRDGLFDIVIMKTKNAFGLIPDFITGILDRGGDFPNRSEAIEICQGREIYVDATPSLEMQFDGEVSHATTPFTVRILPRAARFIVSDECINQYGNDDESPQEAEDQ